MIHTHPYTLWSAQVTGTNATAAIWATYPQPYLSIGGGFVDQVVGTFMLLFGVMAIGDDENMAPDKAGRAALVGLLVVGIGACLGLNAGACPAQGLISLTRHSRGHRLACGAHQSTCPLHWCPPLSVYPVCIHACMHACYISSCQFQQVFCFALHAYNMPHPPVSYVFQTASLPLIPVATRCIVAWWMTPWPGDVPYPMYLWRCWWDAVRLCHQPSP